MTTKHATGNFTHFEAAVRYYKAYMPTETQKVLRDAVQTMINQKVITIGKPSLGSAIDCTVNDEGRYILHYA